MSTAEGPGPRPDRHFTAEQRRRLVELMGRWRAARDAGRSLPDEEQAELQRLVDDEVAATARRADDAWRELSRRTPSIRPPPIRPGVARRGRILRFVS